MHIITLQEFNILLFFFLLIFHPAACHFHSMQAEERLSIIIYCVDTGYSARFTARSTTSCPTSRSPAPSSRCSPSPRTAGARSCGPWRRARAAPPCCSCSPQSGSAAPPSPRPPQHSPPRSTRTSQYQQRSEIFSYIYKNL